MKKNLLLTVLLIISSTPLSTIAANKKILKGVIWSHELESLPSFNVYFHGAKTISNDDGFFSFPLEAEPIKKYSLLISSDIVPTFESINTIGHIEINPKKKYRYFTFKRHTKKTEEWVIKEKKLISKSFIVPDNCIIVDMKPKLVERVENWKFPLDKNFVTIPKIVLKLGLETKNLKHTKSITRASIKSELHALDTKPFHESIEEETKSFPTKPKVKSTLIQPH